MDTHPGLTRISPWELNAKINRNENFFLIDTLTGEHFNSAHIPGAKNACVFEVVFLDNMETIVPGKYDEIVVYGSSGNSMDAATAGDKLARAGYRSVSLLDGGLAGWRKHGYPVEGADVAILSTSGEDIRIRDGAYGVNTDQSVLEWTGRNPNKKHYGTVPLEKGAITVKDGMIDGSFTIDMTGIKSMDLAGDEYEPVLLSHLGSDDFFFAKLFPKAFFTIRSATIIDKPNLSSPNFEIAGDLEIRGNTNRITFPATLTPLQEGGITIEAHFDIDRTRWKIIYGSARFFEHLGMHLVFDLISIQIRLVLSEI